MILYKLAQIVKERKVLKQGLSRDRNGFVGEDVNLKLFEFYNVSQLYLHPILSANM